jgi:queuine tRNA-ribosyltransferase
MLLTWHNLTYYQDLTRGLREAIAEGTLQRLIADFEAAQTGGDLPPLA